MGRFETGTSMSDPRTASMLQMSGPGVDHVEHSGVRQHNGPFIKMSKADRDTCELLIKEMMQRKGCSYKTAKDEIMKNWGMGGPSTGNDTGSGFGMRPKQKLPENEVKKALPEEWVDLSTDTLAKAQQMDEGDIGVLADGTVLILEGGILQKADWMPHRPEKTPQPPMGGGHAPPISDPGAGFAQPQMPAAPKPAVSEDAPTQRFTPEQQGTALLAATQKKQAAPTAQQQNVQQVQQFHKNIRNLGLQAPPADKGKPYHGSDEWRQYHERVRDRAHKYAATQPPPSRFRMGNKPFTEWHADHVGDTYEHAAVKNRVPAGPGTLSALPQAHPAHVGSPAHHHAITQHIAGQTTPGGPPRMAVEGHAAAVAHRDAGVAKYREGRRAGKQPAPPPTLGQSIQRQAGRQAMRPSSFARNRSVRMMGSGTAESHPVSPAEHQAAMSRVKPYKKSESDMTTNFEALGWVDLAEDNIRKSMAMDVGQIGLMPDDMIVVKGEDGLMHPWMPADDEFVPDWVAFMTEDQISKGVTADEVLEYHQACEELGDLVKAESENMTAPTPPPAGSAPPPKPPSGGPVNFNLRSAADKVKRAAGKVMASRKGRSLLGGVIPEGTRIPLTGRGTHGGPEGTRGQVREVAREGGLTPKKQERAKYTQQRPRKGQVGSGAAELQDKPVAVASAGARAAHLAGEIGSGKSGRERRTSEIHNMRTHHEALSRDVDQHPAWENGYQAKSPEARAAVKHLRTKVGSAGGAAGGIHEHRQVQAHTEDSIRHHGHMQNELQEFHRQHTEPRKISSRHTGGHTSGGVAGAAHGVLGKHRNLPGAEHLRTIMRGGKVSREQAGEAAAMLHRHLQSTHSDQQGHHSRQALQQAHDMLDGHSMEHREHLTDKTKNQYRRRARRDHYVAAGGHKHLPTTHAGKMRRDRAQAARKEEQRQQKAERDVRQSHDNALHDVKRVLHGKHGHDSAKAKHIDSMTDLDHAVAHLHPSEWPGSVHGHYNKHEGGKKPTSMGEAPPAAPDYAGRAESLEHEVEGLREFKREHEARQRGRSELAAFKSETIEDWGWTDLVEDTLSKAQAMPDGGVGVMPNGQIVIKEAGYFQPWFPRHPEQVPPWAEYVEPPPLLKSEPNYGSNVGDPAGKWVIRAEDPERELMKSEPVDPVTHIQVGAVTYINRAPAIVKPEGSRVGLDPITAPPGILQD